MEGKFVRISSKNISSLSRIYREYAGHGLREDMVLQRSSGYPAWAYFVSQEPIAFFYCFHFAPDILELANIFISKEERSLGLGGRLIDLMYDDMQEPFRNVIAVNSFLNSTQEEKGDPRNFYLRNGFVEIAETESSVIFWGARDGRGKTL